MRRTVVLAISLAVLAAWGLGQGESGPGGEPISAPATAPASSPAGDTAQLARKYVQLQQEMAKLFADRKWDEAAQKCREFIDVFPRNPEGYYNLACAQARLEQKEQAMASLTKAIELGYEDAAHMREDEDLAGLRDDAKFAALAATATRQAHALATQRAEKYEEMPGVRTIADVPEDGLAYRVRMSPTATKAKPQKLIVWLHPSGSSMNRIVEQLSPMFNQQGYALLVLTYKNFAGWSDADAHKLWDKTLPHAAGIAGLDVTTPILLGFSAGGQLALYQWRDDPGRFGGLVIDAAYPIDFVGRQMKRMDVPTTQSVKKTPMLALVGEKDNGAQVWRALESKWIDAGVPLTVLYVPDKGHAWLFGKEQVAVLENWLTQVQAGQLPTSRPASAPASEPAVSKPAASEPAP